MKRYCSEVQGPKLANMLEFGKTPILPPTDLQEMGFTVAAYPLTLLSASTKAMKETLQRLKRGEAVEDKLLPFQELQADVGFPEFYDEMERYI